jgi:plastocyanin
MGASSRAPPRRVIAYADGRYARAACRRAPRPYGRVDIDRSENAVKRHLITSLVALAALAAAVAGCGGSDSNANAAKAGGSAPAKPAAGGGGGGGGGGSTVGIANFAFSPASITVKAGTKVTVSNHDTTAHTATADDGKSFSTGNIDPNASATFTLPKAGTFKFHCSIHPFMHGTIVVK